MELASSGVVQQCLTDFLHATMSGKRLMLPEISATLAPGDAAKLVNRVSMLARHTAADPALARENIGALLRALHVPACPLGPPGVAPVERLDEWNVGEHAEAFESAWSSTKAASWVSEFAAAGPAAAALRQPPVDQLQSLEQAWAAVRDAPLESAWTEASPGNAAAETGADAASATASSGQISTEEMARARVVAAGIASSAAGQDSVVGQTKFMQFMKQLGDGSLKVEGTQVVPVASGETQQQRSAEELAALDKNDAFHEDGSAALDSWLDEFEDEGATMAIDAEQAAEIARGYSFAAASVNPFVAHAHPFAKAQSLFTEGETSQAVLACEAELLRSPTNAAAWKLLGIAQAQNDNDQQACLALDAAHRLEPNNLDTTLALAVGLTNDLHKDEAVALLREWLAQHPVYRSITPPPASEIERYVTEVEGTAASQDPEFRGVVESVSRNAETLAMFESAARTEHGRNDVNVHVAIGLLHTLMYDFAGAADAFRAAVTLSPRDEQLWNRLGATLANDNRNQEAVDAYNHALQLRPGYVRAHSNMGIALLGLNRPADSACSFLRALSLDPSAEHLWDSLRIVFHQLNRPDLVDRIGFRDPEHFRDDFDF